MVGIESIFVVFCFRFCHARKITKKVKRKEEGTSSSSVGEGLLCAAVCSPVYKWCTSPVVLPRKCASACALRVVAFCGEERNRVLSFRGPFVFFRLEKENRRRGASVDWRRLSIFSATVTVLTRRLDHLIIACLISCSCLCLLIADALAFFFRKKKPAVLQRTTPDNTRESGCRRLRERPRRGLAVASAYSVDDGRGSRRALAMGCGGSKPKVRLVALPRGEGNADEKKNTSERSFIIPVVAFFVFFFSVTLACPPQRPRRRVWMRARDAIRQCRTRWWHWRPSFPAVD